MNKVSENTLFIVGDSQVGKTTIARRIFKDCELILESSMDGATEYRVTIPTKQSPIRIIEIRDINYLIPTEFEFNTEKDIVFLCYAISDPDSFLRISDVWLSLVRALFGGRMSMILIGNKKDLRRDAKVKRSLAKKGLAPVSTARGTELVSSHFSLLDGFYETAINDDFVLDLVAKVTIDTVFNYKGRVI